jgi:hypothetical protein
MCAYVKSFPMVESVFTAEGGDGYKSELLDSLRRARPTLRIVTLLSGHLCLKWAAEATGTMYN